MIVTFLPATPSVGLKSRGVDKEAAAELRARLASFARDWDSPAMAVYDDYDAAKANLQPRFTESD